MRRQVEFICDAHPDLAECPDSLIVHDGDSGEFGLRIHDEGSSSVAIRHCTWCGEDLFERTSNRKLGPPSSVDSSKPAIYGQRKTGNFAGAAETGEFYFVPSSVRKSVCTFVRQLRGPHLRTCA
jgi:hypothetical protein